MHPSRRRKKRPNYGIRTVEVMRGPNGFGFTISGQQPCILSCIVNNSPADHAGLRAGDFLISVNGVSVSKIAHDAVVNLIGNCASPIRMTIAENYYSDSSDEELDCGRLVNSRKPKYMHKPRARVNKADLRRTAVESSDKNVLKSRQCNAKLANVIDIDQKQVSNNESANVSHSMPIDDERPVEYKVLVGYLGTIEMPKQLLPNCRLQTVCSCIRKLRQEKRKPTAVLMSVLPTCLTLKNAASHILAIYPTNRVVYIGTSAERESKYFGLVTSAVCDSRGCGSQDKNYDENLWQKQDHENSEEIEISNSCHVFVTDPKIVDHSIHKRQAENFKINCTTDTLSGNCLEFPSTAMYIVSLIQNIYKLQTNDKGNEANSPVVANSPQPSASSNSDSGIGFRDDCGNISDRILVVEFPMRRPFPLMSNNNRPAAIDATNMNLEALDLPINNEEMQALQLNNVRQQNFVAQKTQNNLSKGDEDFKPLNNLKNIRACEGVNIKNQLSNSDPKSEYVVKQTIDTEDFNKLTCRALLDGNSKLNRGLSPSSATSSDDNTHVKEIQPPQGYSERAIDVPSPSKKSFETASLHSVEFKGSVDNISVHSSKSLELSSILNIFKMPFEHKKSKQSLKVSSCDNLDRYNENIMNYKLSPKVYGLSKPNFSSEELNVEKYGYGSLQDLCSWTEQTESRINIAQSEPDVRASRKENGLCDQNGVAKCISTEGPATWACSFEKLLEDPLGLHTFAEFLKKEFSAENIYFWTACERFRNLPAGSERASEAQRIYQLHLSTGAPEAVNVDAQGRHCTEQSLQEPNSNIFDLAQKQIFNLMKFDSYPRFLKSDIYKKCLSGQIDKCPLDTRLLIRVPVTPSKLKKSMSNAEDRLRKSFLPWNRKNYNRSKSKDRENEHSQKGGDDCVSIGNDIVRNDRTCLSNGSSLTSLDLAVAHQENLSSISHREDLSASCPRTALCRILLSNGSTTVVQIKDSETIQELVKKLLEKRALNYSSFEVYTDKHEKPLDINEPSTKLSGCEVIVEQRVIFKLDLPNRKTISIKSKYTKIIIDVLRPSLHKYNYNLDQVLVLSENGPIDLHLPVTSIDGMRLNVQLLDESKKSNQMPSIRVDAAKPNKLDEITNKVFERILQDKADTARLMKPIKSDKGSTKSEDLGSEHSSTLIGKFLRRDSGMHDKKKKLARIRGANEDSEGSLAKPLIAKWKSGASKLHVTCSESDDLVEGLTRAQRCRLEDQRGTKINFELPDFLKDKEDEQQQRLCNNNNSKGNTQFYIESTCNYSERIPIVASAKNMKLQLHSNYENRKIVAPSTSKYYSDHQSASSSNSDGSNRTSRVIENPIPSISAPTTVLEDATSSPRQEPPPLPPKPKVIPIRPPNWGQLNGFYKPKTVITTTTNRNQAMFLEQSSSSFV